MSKRRLFYLLPMLIMFFWLEGGLEERKPGIAEIKTEKQVLEDFTRIANINIVPKTESGANYSVSGIYFPVNYSGIEGDAFYVGWVNAEKRLTQSYLLVRSQSNSNQLDYILKDTWDDYLPPEDKFRYYQAEKLEEGAKY